jgi:hypothetical protein
MSHIGVLNEKPLHASLKDWYAQPGDYFEVTVERFTIDLVRDDMLLEIQTGNFSSIKAKLSALLPAHRVRLIYPVASEKWIVKQGKGAGKKDTRRKSPRTGCVEDLFGQMVYFPYLITDANFSLHVLLIREEELRRYDAKKQWRRRGWVTEERRLLSVEDQKLLEKPADWLALLPKDLSEPFTTKDMAKSLGISRPLAQKMAYCLCRSEIIRFTGKQGHSHLYCRAKV